MALESELPGTEEPEGTTVIEPDSEPLAAVTIEPLHVVRVGIGSWSVDLSPAEAEAVGRAIDNALAKLASQR